MDFNDSFEIDGFDKPKVDDRDLKIDIKDVEIAKEKNFDDVLNKFSKHTMFTVYPISTDVKEFLKKAEGYDISNEIQAKYLFNLKAYNKPAICFNYKDKNTKEVALRGYLMNLIINSNRNKLKPEIADLDDVKAIEESKQKEMKAISEQSHNIKGPSL